MTISRQLSKTDLVGRWLERRSYDHSQFANLDSLARRKQDLALCVTAVLPTREVAASLAPIIETVHSLNKRARLVDQLLVVDAGSSDGSAALAASLGAEVHDQDELLPQFGPAIGKGDAMWRALAVARGDIVLYLDADTADFAEAFVFGLLGPLLSVPELRFVKASYSRPWTDGEKVRPDGGARVTELTAKPLLNLFYPALSGFAQPLAGEMAATRELLERLPFFTGYAVETGMLIDVLETVGLDAMAQVDLASRTNPHQPLFELGKMSYAVAIAVETRLRRDGRLDEGAAFERDRYVRAIRSADGLRLDSTAVEVAERPPMAELLR
jgi:glucosyl-3-phosphoglycerate synthase